MDNHTAKAVNERLRAALVEARRWIGDGDLSDGLARELWSPEYAAAVDMVDAALAYKIPNIGSTDELDSRPWWSGGTFVTNIGSDRMPALREAVRRFGDSNIVLLEESQPPAPKDYGGCLHNLKPGDLSDFWQVVRDVVAESNKQ